MIRSGELIMSLNHVNYSSIAWGFGIILVIVLFFYIGKLYYYSDEEKDRISKIFSTFYSPSIFTLVVSLRTLAISDFSKTNKPILIILEHLYFWFALSIIINLLNLVLLEFHSKKELRKRIIFYVSLALNCLAFCMWLVVAYLFFDIL